jgi:phage terminase large subunit-like protein
VVVDIAKGVEQIMLPKFKRWIPPATSSTSWDKSWDNANLILTFANGSTIDFVTWGMDMMKLGGVPRHGIFFDEEPPQHIFNESLMRLIDYKGFWVIAATPTKGMGWTFDLLWEPARYDPGTTD